jgi:hypothetical protein
MTALLSIAVLLAAAAGNPVLPVRPRAVTATPKAAAAPATVYMLATPATITFQATNPDNPLVAGNSAATVYAFYNASKAQAWNISVQASAAKFTNCSTVPASAVTVTCSSVSGGAKASCGTAVNLSTTSQIVASGTEAAGQTLYNVNLTFTLTDSWKYIAELSPQCTVSLTYNALFN